MTYSTGTYAGVKDLVEKFKDFAIGTPGWTSNKWEQTGNDWRLHISKSSLYLNMLADVDDATYRIRIEASTGYNGSSAWDAQPGSVTISGVINKTRNSTDWTAIGTYYFFSNTSTEFLFAVAAAPNGTVAYWGICDVDKEGTWANGGPFVWWSGGTGPFIDNVDTTLSSSNDFTYCNMLFDASPTWYGYGYTPKIGSVFPYGVVTNDFNSLPVLHPVPLFRVDTAPYKLYGYLPHSRVCSVTGLSVGHEMVIGSDTWKLFPGSYVGDAYPGFAVKKVT